MDRKKQKKKKNSSAKGWGQNNILEIIMPTNLPTHHSHTLA